MRQTTYTLSLVLLVATLACDPTSTPGGDAAVVTPPGKEGFRLTTQQKLDCEKFLTDLAAIDWREIRFRYNDPIYGLNMTKIDRSTLTRADFAEHPHYQVGYENIFQRVVLDFSSEQGLQFSQELSEDNLDYPTTYKLTGFNGGFCMLKGENSGPNLTMSDVGYVTLALRPTNTAAGVNNNTNVVSGQFRLQFYHTELTRRGTVSLQR